MKPTTLIIFGSLFLVASRASVENVDAIHNMQDFLLTSIQRRGKMIPFAEFMQNHTNLILPNINASSQLAFLEQQGRNLKLLSGSRYPRKEFCADLTPVERYLDRAFLQAYDSLNLKMTLSYKCNCTVPKGNWQLKCSADYYGDRVYYGTTTETVIFSLGGDGLYRMVEAWWGDSEYGDNDTPQETYTIANNGDIAGCKGKECYNCTVCDGGQFIAIDCPLRDTTNTFNFSATCEDNYLGSFLSQYDFGAISEDFTSSGLGPESYVSHLEFCSNMKHLETFMDQYFQDIFFDSDPLITAKFACRCVEEDINLYLTCLGRYTYLGIVGETRDSAHFEARNGVYSLVQASWGDSHFGSVENNREEFFYSNGRLIGCRYQNCTSCRICSDGSTARCEDLEVGDDTCYEPGAFASVYEFGTLLVGSLTSNQDFGDRPGIAVSAGMTLTVSTLALFGTFWASAVPWMQCL